MGAAAAVGAGVAAAGVAGSVIQGKSAQKAASQQASADNRAAQMQMEQYQQTRQDLLPFQEAGKGLLPVYNDFWAGALNNSEADLRELKAHVPQPMTQENLVNTPGYKFNLSQGLRAIQNSNAAGGLGVSGAAMQGAGRFATGLADSTYQQQFGNQQQIFSDYNQLFNNRLNQLQNEWNYVSGPVNMGENAAAQTGTLGNQAANNAGNNLVQAGNAQSAGTTAQGQAVASGINSVANAPFTYLGVQNALNGGNTNQNLLNNQVGFY